MKRAVPLYDGRRLKALVSAHKSRVHRMKKATGKPRRTTAGVKAPR